MTGRPPHVVRAALLAVLVFVVAACGGSIEEVSAGGGGNALLDVTVGTADGGQLEWTSLEGRDVVLWFWAPW